MALFLGGMEELEELEIAVVEIVVRCGRAIEEVGTFVATFVVIIVVADMLVDTDMLLKTEVEIDCVKRPPTWSEANVGITG